MKSSLDRGVAAEAIEPRLHFMVVKLKSSLDRGVLLKLLNQGFISWWLS